MKLTILFAYIRTNISLCKPIHFVWQIDELCRNSLDTKITAVSLADGFSYHTKKQQKKCQQIKM